MANGVRLTSIAVASHRVYAGWRTTACDWSSLSPRRYPYRAATRAAGGSRVVQGGSSSPTCGMPRFSGVLQMLCHASRIASPRSWPPLCPSEPTTRRCSLKTRRQGNSCDWEVGTRRNLTPTALQIYTRRGSVETCGLSDGGKWMVCWFKDFEHPHPRVNAVHQSLKGVYIMADVLNIF